MTKYSNHVAWDIHVCMSVNNFINSETSSNLHLKFSLQVLNFSKPYAQVIY